MTHNQRYYAANREQEKARSLAYYHENKQKIDREKKREYMRAYLQTYQRKKPTPEESVAIRIKRREQYATDPEYREKVKAQARRNNARNPQVKKANHLSVEYGLTLDQFHALLAAQGGRCAICRVEKTGVKEANKLERMLSVDHDHATGRVRGILCHNCNAGIGQFRDDPALLTKAINYLTSG